MKLKTILWLLIITFGLIIAIFFIPPVNQLFRGPIFLLPFFIFFLLGIALIFFARREKSKSAKFLLLTGISSAGFLTSIIFHNLFYALGIITKNIVILPTLFEILHVVFFLIAIPICPLGFIIGITLSLIKIKKNK